MKLKTGRVPVIGLALGGGAARGLAHVGVLKVLLRAGLKPDVIVGTSIGALIGAMYAAEPDPDTVTSRIERYFQGESFSKLRFDFFSARASEGEPVGFLDSVSNYLKKRYFYAVSLTRRSFINEEDFLANIAELVDDILLENTRIPMGVVCTDIHEGKRVVLSEGPMRRAVAASSAIPGVLPPINVDGRYLVDGGWVDQLPSEPCRIMGADFVIGVDVARNLEEDFNLDLGVDILRRANQITRHTLNDVWRRDADFVITPDVAYMNWAGFDCAPDCIRRGERAAEYALPQLRYALERRTPWWSRVFRKAP